MFWCKINKNHLLKTHIISRYVATNKIIAIIISVSIFYGPFNRVSVIMVQYCVYFMHHSWTIQAQVE